MSDKKQPSDYRAKADECLRMADGALDPAHKQSWVRLAASWLRMIPDTPLSALPAEPKSSADDDKGEPGDRR